MYPFELRASYLGLCDEGQLQPWCQDDGIHLLGELLKYKLYLVETIGGLLK